MAKPLTSWLVPSSSRRMPGYIREFNRLKPHSSHDLVFKIWRNNKTDATLRVFCLWLWVTRNQISLGTTGILISKNIKFKILPSINASLSDFTGFFALKTNQKIAIFVWIFTCVDFRGKMTTKVCRNRERYHLTDISRLPLKPTQSFKPKNVIKTSWVFVFLWIWPKPVRGSLQREVNFQKTSLNAKKDYPRFASNLFIFSNLFPVLLDRFVVFSSCMLACMLHLEVSRTKTAKY